MKTTWRIDGSTYHIVLNKRFLPTDRYSDETKELSWTRDVLKPFSINFACFGDLFHQNLDMGCQQDLEPHLYEQEHLLSTIRYHIKYCIVLIKRSLSKDRYPGGVKGHTGTICRAWISPCYLFILRHANVGKCGNNTRKSKLWIYRRFSAIWRKTTMSNGFYFMKMTPYLRYKGIKLGEKTCNVDAT